MTNEEKMTPEEAIAEISFLKVAVNKVMEQALEMAIQALSQESTEKPMTVDEMEREYEKSKALFHKIVERDDAISREDAVHALRKALWDYEDKTEKQFRERDDLDYEEWYFHRIFVQAMNDEDVEAICKLPSVTQKSGKWDKLYSWLNDMRLCIAPDETVTDIDERHCRESQTDILDEIMEWMIKTEVEPQERSDKECGK